MKSLIFRSETCTGTMDMDTTDMVSVPAKKHYNVVDICLKADGTKGMNLAVAEIGCSWLSYDEKVKLGAEIARRWNAAAEHQAEPACFENDCPAIWDGKCTSTRNAECGIRNGGGE